MAFWKNREDRATKEVANLSIVTGGALEDEKRCILARQTADREEA